MVSANLAAPDTNIDALYRRNRIRVMLAITLGYGFIYTCRLGISIVKKPLIDQGIFSVEDLGMIGSAFFYGYAFGKLLNGFAADHVGPRFFFSSAIFISAIINLWMGWSTLVWLSIALWGLNGWFQGQAAPSAVVSITNWFSIKERGRCYGIWNASHSIGEGITFLVLAAVVSALGWRYGYILPGIICIGVAAWVYSFMEDAPQTMGLPAVNKWKDNLDEPEQEKSTWHTQKVVFGIGAIWVVALSSALMYMTRYGVNSWGVLYLQEEYGYSLIQAGIFLTVNTIAGIAGSIIYGFVSDNLFDARRPPANLIFAIVEIVALLIIFYGPNNEIMLAVGFALYGAGLSGLMAAIGGLFAVDIAPRGAAGAAMGLVGGLSYLGAGTQEIITARLIDGGLTIVDGVRHYNFDAAINYWIGMSVLSMILAASLWNTKIRD
jgi:OPA family sugar phosphate sensor protein UhpC-like MFS transporter